ncbi:ABC transporter permease [Vagococcus entomophilus]|uniref:Transport permease protein n=1 Tax=Vagococcus entomophilus TaxID=1160095 RepID=A0A430AII4_9ENTE|nr:ABC transporter permease [Vagococcus entomophilus]RSU07900.1 teichoic acid ABC transporter permease [Vagococcus entomophilus]
MLKELCLFFKDIYQNRKLLVQFSLNDFKSRYAGSMFGIIWAFVNPLVMVCTYSFVFSHLKAAPAQGFPFVLYLITGIVPWFFFSDVLSTATGVFREYSYLVKKVVFNIRILPTAKLLSNLYTHFFFLAVAFVLSIAYGFFPTLQTLQLIYYLFCLAMFLTGLTWITASIQPFFSDISQLIGVVMQALMWTVPVLWSPEIFASSPWIVKILKLNPLYYVISGYRDSFLSQGWFWQHWAQTVYFWVITIALLLVGSLIFKKLKPHFSDVL